MRSTSRWAAGSGSSREPSATSWRTARWIIPTRCSAGFDYVVASVHSHFRMSREEMTARIIRAVSNPRVTMLGHPTGRLLLARDSYAVDLDAVIDAAAKAGTMIEINANPHRLDLDAVHCRRARQKGVRIVINPDAHSTQGLHDLGFGISVARRAWLTAEDVFNTAPVEAVPSARAHPGAAERPSAPGSRRVKFRRTRGLAGTLSLYNND